MTKSDRIAKKLQERDGLDCFLCGKTHTSLARMSVGFVATEQTVEHAYLACTGCNKRRNNRPLGAYIRQRLKEAREEVLYIETSFDPGNKSSRVTHDVWQALQRPIKVYQSELEEEEEVENPSLARDIQDVPWEELFSAAMDMDAFNALNKTPASEHERELIRGIEAIVRYRSGLDEEPLFSAWSEPDAKGASIYCKRTGNIYPCQWDGQEQYVKKGR